MARSVVLATAVTAVWLAWAVSPSTGSDRQRADATGGDQTQKFRVAEGAEARAVSLMMRGLVTIREARRAKGLPVERALDPHDTGIIGDEFTPLTTSLGDAAAKRAAAHPLFAAIVARHLSDAGLRAGDVVAVGASGSFPGFILATLAAARALGLVPVTVYSVGSSMYGANLPGFTFFDMLEALRADGVLPYRFAAVAPGGRDDTGSGVLFHDDSHSLDDEARRSGVPIAGGGSLAVRIRERLQVFERAAAGRPIRCFVNIGGAAVNFGTTPASLDLPNGLVRRVATLPDSPARGLVFEFLARDVPVVHLLHVRGLAAASGIPYDPR